MDLETVSAEDFGRSLRGIGLNLLSADVPALAAFLEGVFGASVHRLSKDFAIVAHGGTVMQLHADGTYGGHPLLGLVPETAPRGGGVQVFLFGADPEAAVAAAERFGGVAMEPPRVKPHGLYEATVVSAEGFAFTAAVTSEGRAEMESEV